MGINSSVLQSPINTVGGIFGGVATSFLGGMSQPPAVPTVPAAPPAPPPPPSFSQANITQAAMAARQKASLAGAAQTVATGPTGVPSPAQTTKQFLGG